MGNKRSEIHLTYIERTEESEMATIALEQMIESAKESIMPSSDTEMQFIMDVN
ncbi:MAG: hypothetical protein IIY49_12080 [Eubacterium sp.]|nr:hypothetical protein [Eubacterium sp.]